MRENFDTILRSGSDDFAAVVAPRQAHQVRAASDRRQRRNLAVSGVAVLAVLAAGGAYATFGHPGRSAASSGKRPGVVLHTPRPFYQAGQLNPVTLTISNPGRQKTATVQVRFGSVQAKAGADTAQPDVVQVLGRHGSWVDQAVTGSDRQGYLSSFPVALRTGKSTVRLQVQPSGNESVAVQVRSGGSVLAVDQERSYSPSFPLLSNDAQTGARKHLDFTFTAANQNRLAVEAEPVQLIAYANCQSGCSGRSGFALQWLNGGSWQSVPVSPVQGSVLESVSIPVRVTVTTRLRVTPLPGRGTVQGAIALGVREPGQGSSAATMYFRIRAGLVRAVNGPHQQATVGSVKSAYIPGMPPATGPVLLARTAAAGKHSYRTPASPPGPIMVRMTCVGGRRSELARVLLTGGAGQGKALDDGPSALQCGHTSGTELDGPFNPGAQPDGIQVEVTVPRDARVVVLITRA